MAGKVEIDRRIPSDLQPRPLQGLNPQAPQQEPSYYDVSMLQPPVWEGYFIGPYFFLGGVAGGAYLLSRVAEWVAGREYRQITRAGSTVALLATVPCAPLLIADLGDPSRFHHMLRVFKPQSPMNLGAWTLTGFSAAAAAAVLREFRRGPSGSSRKTGDAIDCSLTVVMDAAGVPLALLLMSYTGVLISGAATPVWCKNKWLAPLFAASAVGNGSSAISLALKFLARRSFFGREVPGQKALDRIDTIAHVAETILLVQYLTSLGKLNKPLTAGAQPPALTASTAATIASEVLKYLPVRPAARDSSTTAAACAGLLGGLLLKYSILQAGKSSAQDPRAARLNTTPRSVPVSKFPRPYRAMELERGQPAPSKLLNL